MLLDACWDEFSRVSFADASINRIVQQAHIARGSFYLYFEDKEDAFCYLLRNLSATVWDILRPYFHANPTDLPKAFLSAFDGFFLCAAPPEAPKFYALQLLRSNPFLDWTQVFSPLSAFGDHYSPIFSLACCAFFTCCKQTILTPEDTLLFREELQTLLQTLCSSGHIAYFSPQSVSLHPRQHK